MAKKKVSKSIKKQLLNIGFLVILIAVTVIVIFTATDIKFGDIFKFLGNCNPWWIVGALGLTIASVLFEAVSIYFIMRGLGAKRNFYKATCYTTADLYYSAITPSGTGGQPASIYYMVKDGINAGKASFGLVFNLAGYTLSIIIIGAVSFAVRPGIFATVGMGGDWFPQVLIIAGCVIQGLLLAFFIGCMFWGKAVKKAGNGIITLLTKIHIIKKPDKWRDKLSHEVDLYKDCLYEIRNHPGMSIINVFANLGQRVCHVLIPVFVILAQQPNADVWGLCACSALIIIGYNSIPLPGGVGVYEYLYVSIYATAGLGDKTFVLAALMVSRFISYYLIMIVCGLFTLAYHIQVMRRPPKETSEEGEAADGEGAEQSPTEDADEETEEILSISEEEDIGERYGREWEENGKDRGEG